MALSSVLRLTSSSLVRFRPLFSAPGHCPRGGFLELLFLSTGHPRRNTVLKPRRRDKEDTRERKVEEEGSNGTVLIKGSRGRGSVGWTQAGASQDTPDYQAVDEIPQDNTVSVHAQSVGKRISAEDKKRLLVNTLLDLKDSKEVVYGTLDAWVAWEQNFPLAMLKRALLVLEKGEQWHRIVQVLKWMLSKGQGTTMGTYEQLICALEKDNRPEEAHTIWVKKISYDLHSVPWRFCDLMLSIYYRNNMLERLVKLFEDIESYGRKPPSKSIVRKVVDAYELLGLLEEKNRVLQKYDDLFNISSRESPKKLRKFSKRGIAAGKKKLISKAPMDRQIAGYAPADSASGAQA